MKKINILTAKMKEIAEARLNSATEIPIASIINPPFQDRNTIDEETLIKLALNIKEVGLLNPIIVRKKGKSDKFERLAGYRRIEAYKKLNLENIPAVVLTDIDDTTAMMITLSENMQREDLNPFDEINSLLHLIALSLNMTEEEVKAALIRIENSTKGYLKVFSLDDQEIKKEVEEILDKVVTYKLPGLVKKLSILKLNPMLIEAIKKNNLPYTFALLLNKVKDIDNMKGLLKETLEQPTSYKLLAEKVKIVNDDGNFDEPNPCIDIIKKLKNFDKIPKEKRVKLMIKIEEIKALLAS